MNFHPLFTPLVYMNALLEFRIAAQSFLLIIWVEARKCKYFIDRGVNRILSTIISRLNFRTGKKNYPSTSATGAKKRNWRHVPLLFNISRGICPNAVYA